MMVRQTQESKSSLKTAGVEGRESSSMEILKKSESTKVLASTVGGAAIGNLITPGIGGIVGGAIGGALGITGGVLGSIFGSTIAKKVGKTPGDKEKEGDDDR